MQQRLKQKAIALLSNGIVDRVLGWKTGEFCYDLTPAVFRTAEEVENDFVFLTNLVSNSSLTVAGMRDCSSAAFFTVNFTSAAISPPHHLDKVQKKLNRSWPAMSTFLNVIVLCNRKVYFPSNRYKRK